MFDLRADTPVAVLKLPKMLLCKAFTPIAVLSNPDRFENNA